MNARYTKDTRATWRDRFLQIARQVEAAAERSQAPVALTGLRARSRMAGFAVLRRGRSSIRAA